MYTQQLLAAALAAASIVCGSPTPSASLPETPPSAVDRRGGPSFTEVLKSLPQNMCGPTAMRAGSAASAASVKDCQGLVGDLTGAAVYYKAWGWDDAGDVSYQVIASHGTCAFGVVPAQVGAGGDIYVGNADVTDLVSDSIRRFAKDGKVASLGTMSCSSTEGPLAGACGIYHIDQTGR